MKMQYEIIEENRKKRFNQLVALLKSEMVIKSERVKVIETSDGPMICIRTALISLNLTEKSKEFYDFSIGNYDEFSLIKTMLEIKVNGIGFGRFDIIDIPLSLNCNVDKLICEIVEIHNKYGFEEPLINIMNIITKQNVYAYDMRYSCNCSGELILHDVWNIFKEKNLYILPKKCILKTKQGGCNGPNRGL